MCEKYDSESKYIEETLKDMNMKTKEIKSLTTISTTQKNKYPTTIILSQKIDLSQV